MLDFPLPRLLVAATLCAPLAFADTDTPPDSYGAREDVQNFAYELAQEHGFDYDELMTVLAQAERKDRIIELMDRTPEGTWTWEKYRKHFLDKQRINGGVKFWKEHRETLQMASEKYGVPPETIVAIIGVETRYGTVKGRTRIIDALMTLGFDYPRRARYFRKELLQFLLLIREQKFDPLDVQGSYAGAMGWGQFMPSSYRTYAVDFDGDDIKDLLQNPVDAIGSVANYLSVHGWERGLIPAIPARLKSEPPEEAIQFNKRKPSYLLSDIKAWINPKKSSPFAPDEKLIALRLSMEDEKPPQYWLGSKNLYVITRYNTSLLYAMAVHELGQTIQKLAKKANI